MIQLMNEKYLILKGCEGLGNRLYCLCNAIEYCQRNNRTILVDWSDRFSFISDYDCLKEIKSIYPQNYFQNIKVPITDIYSRNICNHIFGRIYPYLPKGPFQKLHGCWKFISKYGHERTVSDIIAFKSLFNKNEIPLGGFYADKMKEDIIIYADSIPDFNTDTLLINVRLQEWVKLAIEHQKNNLKIGNRTIGVHVRNTDKKPVKSYLSLITFINEEIKDYDNIFLATDSKEVEKCFRAELSNFVTLKRLYTSNNYKGIHLSEEITDKRRHLLESIMDMWLLSNCGLLLYQGNSSYSRIANLMHTNYKKAIDWNTINI
jgi:hypothetical protein